MIKIFTAIFISGITIAQAQVDPSSFRNNASNYLQGSKIGLPDRSDTILKIGSSVVHGNPALLRHKLNNANQAFNSPGTGKSAVSSDNSVVIQHQKQLYYPGPDYYHPGSKAHSTCQRSYMDHQEYNRVLWITNSKCGDQAKLNALFSSLAGTYFSVQQANGLIALLQHDYYKLEAAKFMHYNILDKHNLHLIGNSFSHQYYKEQFYMLLYQGNHCDGNLYEPVPGSHCPVNENAPYISKYFSSSDFQLYKMAIQKQSFSSDKMIILKQGVKDRMVSSRQVSELLALFSFESDKVKAAKYLYGYTHDKENYYVVNNSFSFSSSVREMNDYIGPR